MNIRAIPTEYNGVQFRSRLEARWAAFFDQMKWRWAYEPFDLDGWIPDFVVGPYLETGAYVEVKPIDWDYSSEWAEVEMPELVHARNAVPLSSRGFVICGLRPLFGDYDRIGPLWEPRWQRWMAPCFSKKSGDYDLCVGSRGDYPGLMTGVNDFTDAEGNLKAGEIKAIWNRAGNAVQWRAPRSAA